MTAVKAHKRGKNTFPFSFFGKRLALLPALAGFLLTSGGCYYAESPLPHGLDCRSEALPASEVRFLCDQTGLDGTGKRVSDQQIFDAVFAMIGHAQYLVVVDMFLFNEFPGKGPAPYRRLCSELTDALIARKQAAPSLRAVLITDPVNTVYGGLEAPHLARLRQAGVEVVITRLDQLRDSNPAWSSVWRVLFWPWGNSTKGGWVANPFDSGDVTLRSWMALLNFKANHRKVVITDADDGLHALVTSANPHDGSSAHTNVALLFNGPAAWAALATEQAVLDFSMDRPIRLDGGLFTPPACRTAADSVRVQILTEEAVAGAAETLIGSAQKDDHLDVVMFYLADRTIIHALKDAARRGATLRVTLDPNKDAFGREKNGMPNRQAAHELVAAGVPVRWALTHGEQMHAKMLLVRRSDGTAELLLGSANFTRRNVRNYNLETDVRVSGRSETPALADASAFADRLWTNTGGRTFTTPYETFRDDSSWRTFLYRVQEATGLCTW